MSQWSNKLKIAIIGGNGMLGSDLRNVLFGNVLTWNHEQIDIRNLSSLEVACERDRPNIIINTAAFHDVDKCETEKDLAYRVNVEGAENVAKVAKKFDATLVHVSTDYVFGLEKNRDIPYTEEDLPAPCNFYGMTKCWGEQVVRATISEHFIIRTCGLYGNTDRNFVATMVKLAKQKKLIYVVADQFCSPTGTRDVADCLSSLMFSGLYGTYNVVNTGVISWYDFAVIIFEICKGLGDVNIRPCTSSYFNRVAQRPSFSALDNTKIQSGNMPCQLPAIEMGLVHYLAYQYKDIFSIDAFRELFGDGRIDDEEKQGNEDDEDE